MRKRKRSIRLEGSLSFSMTPPPSISNFHSTNAIKKLLTMRFCRYLSNNQGLTFLLVFSIQSRTWSDRTVDKVVTEVDQEGSGMMMTGHSLGSHGLEQAELSFHLARDTVRYTGLSKVQRYLLLSISRLM